MEIKIWCFWLKIVLSSYHTFTVIGSPQGLICGVHESTMPLISPTN